MIHLQLQGAGADLWALLASPETQAALEKTRGIKSLMLPYQQAALYRLARQYDGGRILEIGCYHGCSALIMALAAPEARIVTMSPDREQVETARRNLAGQQVEVLHTRSAKYWTASCWAGWDMVYVDGDHLKVRLDMPWFNRLRTGGLMLFHDYTPATAAIDIAERKPHPHVYAAVNALAERLGRKPDVLVSDHMDIGMAGFYRRKGEQWISTS